MHSFLESFARTEINLRVLDFSAWAPSERGCREGREQAEKAERRCAPGMRHRVRGNETRSRHDKATESVLPTFPLPCMERSESSNMKVRKKWNAREGRGFFAAASEIRVPRGQMHNPAGTSTNVRIVRQRFGSGCRRTSVARKGRRRNSSRIS